jgi:hypothetical protein
MDYQSETEVVKNLSKYEYDIAKLKEEIHDLLLTLPEIKKKIKNDREKESLKKAISISENLESDLIISLIRKSI